jgi:hypothetical protein
LLTPWLIFAGIAVLFSAVQGAMKAAGQVYIFFEKTSLIIFEIKGLITSDILSCLLTIMLGIYCICVVISFRES